MPPSGDDPSAWLCRSPKLSKAQVFALEHITKYARTRKIGAREETKHVLQMSNISQTTLETAVDKIKTYARVALHFHPDRPEQNMKTVAEALLESGLYRSQFETLISSGSVSAFPGGERDDWERKIFGGAYHADIATNSQRPKYGALDMMLHPDGPAPRFGSCYFLLNPAVSWRCTFTYLDSHYDPKEKGTYEEFDDIIAALFVESFVRDFALGESELTPTKLMDHLLVNLDKPLSDPANRAAVRNLNHYIEAQVHGDVSLAEDVDTLVADPSFQKTQTGKVLEEICQQYAINLYWHCGFALPLTDVPDNFRGPSMPSLANRIANEDYVDVSMIGPAVFDLKRNPSSWSERGSGTEVLQELKILWHVLVKYGRALLTLKG